MKTKLKSIQASIDVWDIFLPELQSEVEACRALLNAGEQERASKYIKSRDSERSILSRGVLRRVLGSYLDELPSTLNFELNENGKPFLKDSELQFNVSHSHDRLLIAATAGRAVGVDIEFRRTGVAMDSIAERWFSPEERAFFQGSEKPQQVFFEIWSKKEAYVKALGMGIFQELNLFTVPLAAPPKSPTLGKIDRWVFQTLEIDPAYAAAIVFEAPAIPVQLRKFKA